MLRAIEKALLLQEVDLLRYATADHLMLLAEAGREVSFRKGELIVRAGSPPTTLYLLLRGRAAFDEAGGQALEKTALNFYFCIAGAEHTAGCLCLEDCTALALERPDLLALLAGEPELPLALLKYYASGFAPKSMLGDQASHLGA